ncbi:N-acetyltransferase [Kurthia gibsonii]|uniref:GNAT family N-acetyltransferase n=1 Tax=Kurthia gibsonii TaxID=33946 RepID=UPI000EB119A5|nr:GNAT family protein [Kurthia gibsonii]RXH51863.1 N-acetyltransferase [Kurthia gibsonii]
MEFSQLEDDVVYLRPLVMEDAEALFEAGNHAEIWTYTAHTIQSLKDAEAYIEDALHKSKTEQTYAIVDRQSNRVIGSTRFYQIDTKNRAVTLGYTWLTPGYFGTSVNKRCKYLLFQYAFEKEGLERIQIVADERNTRSCRAIEGLLATKEGVLRKHIICKDGYIRNSVVYSVIREDWPRVKAHLEQAIGYKTV